VELTFSFFNIFATFNPDYVFGFVMKAEIARKSGSLETSTAMGEVENCND